MNGYEMGDRLVIAFEGDKIKRFWSKFASVFPSLITTVLSFVFGSVLPALPPHASSPKPVDLKFELGPSFFRRSTYYFLDGWAAES